MKLSTVGILSLICISQISQTSAGVADTYYQQHYDQDPVHVENEGAGGDAEGGSVQMTMPETKIDGQGLEGRLRNTLDEKISIDIRTPDPPKPVQPAQPLQPAQQVQKVQPETPSVVNTFSNNFVVSIFYFLSNF